MPLKPKLALAGSLVAAVAIAGCGGRVGFAPASATASSATLTQIRSVITGFARAMAVGDGSTACELLDPSAQEQLAEEATSGQSDGAVPVAQLCQQAIVTVGVQLDGRERGILNTLHVGRITVSADGASIQAAQLTSPDGTAPLGQGSDDAGSALALVMQNGQWLIDNLG